MPAAAAAAVAPPLERLSLFQRAVQGSALGASSEALDGAGPEGSCERFNAEQYPSLTPATVSSSSLEEEGEAGAGAVAGIACPVYIQFAFPTESYTFS